MKSKLFAAALVGSWAILATPAHSALVSLGDGTVQDTATNLIWLRDWNVNGLQNWTTQTAWAEGLTFAGSSNWILPSIGDYATLFAEVGGPTAVGDFLKVQSYYYWSRTESDPGVTALFFVPSTGEQNGFPVEVRLFAVAARAADLVAFVPEPQNLALAMLPLDAVVVARRSNPASCALTHSGGQA